MVAQVLSNDLTVPWDEFRDGFSWSQGEHLTCLGPTGNGKTTLILEILPLQPWVVFFGTKPRDEAYSRLIHEYGYRRVKRWEDRSPVNRNVLLWPDSRRLSAPVVQRPTFEKALSEIFEQGAWAVVFDEVLEFSKDLKMPNTVNRFLAQGRSNRNTVVSGSQRPFDVPQRCYSQATHLFLWRTTDERDVKRFSEISGNVDKREIIRQLYSLPSRYHFLYVNTRTGEMAVSRVDR